MSIPIRQHMYGMAVFSKGFSHDEDEKERVRLAMDGPLKKDVDEMLDAVAAASVLSVSPNRTGMKLEARIRFRGKSLRLSFCPFEGTSRTPAPRTEEGVARELLGQVIRKDPFRKRLNESFKKRIYWSEQIARDLLMEEVCGGERPKVVRELMSAMSVASGDLASAHRGHQTSRAVRLMKEFILHAIRNGADMDVLRREFDECVVKSVMEG